MRGFLLLVLLPFCLCSHFTFLDVDTGKETHAESVEASFGPDAFDDLINKRIQYVKDLCNYDSFPMDNNTKLLLVEKMDGCSHAKRAQIAQRSGAEAMVVVNDEETVGMLFSMWNDFQNRKVDIPSIVITKEDGEAIRDGLDKHHILLINITHNPSTTMKDAWVSAFLVFAVANGILFIAGVASFVFVVKSTANYQWSVKLLIGIMALHNLLEGLILFVDFWSVRGIISRAVFQLIYGLGIDCIICAYFLIIFLWFNILRKRKILVNNGLKLSQPILFVMFGSVLVADAIKITLVGFGYSVRFSWGTYNVVLSTWCICVGILCGVYGWRLRMAIKRILSSNESSKAKKVTLLTCVSCPSMIFTAASLILWITAPDAFGVWSWWIFNVFWRIVTIIFSILILFTFGVRTSKAGATTEDSANKNSVSFNYESKNSIERTNSNSSTKEVDLPKI